jgi:hypothetical protein
MFSFGVTGGRIPEWIEKASDDLSDRQNRSSLPHGLPPTWIFEATAEANEGWTISASPDTLYNRP